MMRRDQEIKASRDQVSESRSLGSSLRGFTLVELLVAIVVLLAVIIAMSRIFSTASDVTGIGQATATIMQEAAVIERRMREDLAELSPDGVFAIRQVAVPNNVHGDENLLDPALPPDHVFRADQLLFFTDSVRAMETSRLGGAGNIFGMGTFARVYWGHAFQLPNASGYEPGANRMHDPLRSLTPWHRGDVQMVRTFIDQVDDDNTGTNIYSRELAGVIDGTQPPPRRWLLARQAVTLVDDDTQAPNTNAKTVFLSNVQGGGGNQTARSIFIDSHTDINVFHPVFGWSRELRNGRMDAAASQRSEVRRWIRTLWDSNDPAIPHTPRPWSDDDWFDQRDVISSQMLYYPRGERRAPSMHRVDQALTNHVIGSAVSDLVIEWTWNDGTGDLFDEEGNRLYYCQNPSVCELGTIRSEKELDFRPLSPSMGSSLDFDESRWAWWPFGFYTNWYFPAVSPAYEYQPEQPWFGINRTSSTVDPFCDICPDRGVGFYSDAPYHTSGQNQKYQVRANFKPADTIFPNNIRGWNFNDHRLSTIERWDSGLDFGPPFSDAEQSDEIRVYEAIFGFNRTHPMRDISAETPRHLKELYDEQPGDDSLPRISREVGYTPWPSAIRVTMTLHDPQGRVESGRTVQFVIELPQRARGRTQ